MAHFNLYFIIFHKLPIFYELLFYLDFVTIFVLESCDFIY